MRVAQELRELKTKIHSVNNSSYEAKTGDTFTDMENFIAQELQLVPAKQIKKRVSRFIMIFILNVSHCRS